MYNNKKHKTSFNQFMIQRQVTKASKRFYDVDRSYYEKI